MKKAVAVILPLGLIGLISLIRLIGSNSTKTLTAGNFTATFTDSVKISSGNYAMAFSTPPNFSQSSQTGDLVTYKDQSSQTEIVYKISDKGVKEEIILKSAQDIKPSYLFEMNLNNLNLKKAPNGLWQFYDKTDKDFQTPLLKITAPFMIDAKGAKSQEIYLKKVEKDGKLYLELNIDTEWLKSKGRFYPVTIDPSIEEVNQNNQEIISRRTINSKTFAGQSYFTNFYTAPIHYRNQNNTWSEIDTTIVPSTDPAFDFMNITNTDKIFFSSDANKIQKGDAWITFKTVSGVQGNPIAQKDEGFENRLLYSNNIRYTVQNNKLSEEIIITSPADLSQFSQSIDLHNVIAKQVDKEIHFFNKTTNEFLFFMPAPVMYEKNERFDPQTNKPSKFENYDLHYEMTCDGSSQGTTLQATADQQGSSLRKETCVISKIIDPKGLSWLSDPERQYPVIIDPTVDYADSSTDGYIIGNSNTWGTARLTSSSYNSDGASFPVGSLYLFNVYFAMRGYLEFDTSGIPDDATLSQANLYLMVKNNYSDTDYNVRIHKYAWTSPLSSANRESNYDGALASTFDANWQNTSGISTLNTYYGSSNLDTTWVNITGITQYSLLASNDVSNTAPSGNEYIDLYSAEEGAIFGPYLEVIYTTPSPTQIPSPTPSFPPGTIKFQGVKMSGVLINANTDWWNMNYQYRKQITVTATDAVSRGYSVPLTFDHAALVTAGKSLASGNDVRIIYNPSGFQYQEIDRSLDEGSSWNNASTKIWFKLQSAIAASGTDSKYYLYYNDPNAVNPPTNKSNIFTFWDNFSTDTSANYTVLSGTWTWDLVNGQLLCSATGLLRVGNISAGNVEVKIDALHNTGNTAVILRSQSSTFLNNAYSFGSDPSGGTPQSWIGKYAFGSESYLTTGGYPPSGSWASWTITATGSSLSFVNGAYASLSTTDSAYSSGYVMLKGDVGDAKRYDNLRIRLYTGNEPTTGLGSETTKPSL